MPEAPATAEPGRAIGARPRRHPTRSSEAEETPVQAGRRRRTQLCRAAARPASPGPPAEAPAPAEPGEEPQAVYDRVLRGTARQRVLSAGGRGAREGRPGQGRDEACAHRSRRPTRRNPFPALPQPTVGRPSPNHRALPRRPRPSRSRAPSLRPRRRATAAATGSDMPPRARRPGPRAGGQGGEDPEAVYERVLAEEKAKGSSPTRWRRVVPRRRGSVPRRAPRGRADERRDLAAGRHLARSRS